MTLKQFFKSTALKCILVLLAISLVAGGLLSVMNDLLEVTEEEKITRVISKLYDGAEVSVNKLEISESELENNYGVINSAFELSDGNMVINSTGAGGYKGGTVTTWTIVMLKDNKVDSIKAVSIDSYDKQTLMSQLGAKFTSVYATSVNNGEYFSTASGEGLVQNVVTGATMSSNATNNAVSAAVKYARIRTGEVVVSNLVNADNVKNVKISADKATNTVSYTFSAVSVSTGMPNNYDLAVTVTDGKIASINVITDGATSGYGAKVLPVSTYNGMDQAALNAFLSSGTIKTGATNSNKTIVNSLLFATGNFEYFVNGGTLGDDTMDAIKAFYGADTEITYTEIEALDPDQAIDVEAAYELSNKDYAVLTTDGEYVFVAEDATVKNEVSEAAANAAASFVKKYSGAEATYKYARYVSDVTYTWTADNTVVYKLTAKSVMPGMPNDYSLQVTVVDGKINRVSVKGDEAATYGYEQYVLPIGRTYNGLDEDGLLAMLKSDKIQTGATNSNTTVIQGLLYATANYDALKPNALPYQSGVKVLAAPAVDGAKVTYELTAKSVGDNDNYDLTVVVTDGKIESMAITKDGLTLESVRGNVLAATAFNGLDEEGLKALVANGDVSTGATHSNKTIVNALLFATANYTYILEGGSI